MGRTCSCTDRPNNYETNHTAVQTKLAKCSSSCFHGCCCCCCQRCPSSPQESYMPVLRVASSDEQNPKHTTPYWVNVTSSHAQPLQAQLPDPDTAAAAPHEPPSPNNHNYNPSHLAGQGVGPVPNLRASNSLLPISTCRAAKGIRKPCVLIIRFYPLRCVLAVSWLEEPEGSTKLVTWETVALL